MNKKATTDDKMNVEQFGEISEEQMQNPHFHCSLKGCKMISKKIEGKRRKRCGDFEMAWINGFWCDTHQVELCRCGWEFSHYYK